MMVRGCCFDFGVRWSDLVIVNKLARLTSAPGGEDAHRGKTDTATIGLRAFIITNLKDRLAGVC